MKTFSNGTEAMDYLSMNCDRCKRYGCSARKNIELGFITGEVSQRTSDYVGGFENKCNHFINTPLQKVKKKKKDLQQIEIEL
jgi:hypothetical protein